MKRFFPAIVFVLSAFWIGASFVPAKKSHDDLDLAGFGKIPVLVGGRVKPLDTVAGNSLLIIHTKQTLRLDDGRQISAIKWLADALFNAPVADQYPAFVIQNADVLGLFGWQQSDRKYFSFTQLTPFLKQIDEQGEQADKLQAVERSAYQSAILNLRNALVLYQRLKNSLQPEGADNFAAELQAFEQAIPEAARAARARETGVRFDQTQLDQIAEVMQGYERLADMAYLLAVPPPSGSGDWRSVGQAIMQSIAARGIDPMVKLYASLGDAYRAGDGAAFDQTVNHLTDRIAQSQPTGVKRARYEFFFNAVDPFTHSMTLYVLAFLLACISWLAWQRPLNRAAFYLLLLALAVHTFGLVSRMYLQERPPVTNLYSSAIFIGWGAVIVALILERIFRDGIGAACAGAIGFITLIIAHHLAGNGDTLEMLQAVLDTNIWLATHVVAITTGYSAMFLAGMLAIIYIIRGVFTRSLKKETADSLARMTYGVVCFATLFSFVGTVLGGIWADQSWGRFWGWDPKENGAVLIVLWCAITLHARWAGLFVSVAS
jgi:ABC-type transport system involved in cytochrome c biogenesis permease subunit